MSLTGPQAKEGRLTQEATTSTASYVKAHGGLHIGKLRYDVAPHYRDDGSSPPRTALAVEERIEHEHVDFVLGL